MTQLDALITRITAANPDVTGWSEERFYALKMAVRDANTCEKIDALLGLAVDLFRSGPNSSRVPLRDIVKYLIDRRGNTPATINKNLPPFAEATWQSLLSKGIESLHNRGAVGSVDAFKAFFESMKPYLYNVANTGDQKQAHIRTFDAVDDLVSMFLTSGESENQTGSRDGRPMSYK